MLKCNLLPNIAGLCFVKARYRSLGKARKSDTNRFFQASRRIGLFFSTCKILRKAEKSCQCNKRESWTICRFCSTSVRNSSDNRSPYGNSTEKIMPCFLWVWNLLSMVTIFNPLENLQLKWHTKIR